LTSRKRFVISTTLLWLGPEATLRLNTSGTPDTFLDER
jgi:hypothetical protein